MSISHPWPDPPPPAPEAGLLGGPIVAADVKAIMDGIVKLANLILSYAPIPPAAKAVATVVIGVLDSDGFAQLIATLSGLAPANRPQALAAMSAAAAAQGTTHPGDGSFPPEPVR